MSFLDRFQRVVPNGKFFPELDGLRFLAIILVMFFHAIKVTNSHLYEALPYDYSILNIFQYGFQGVELFFIISGYIIGIPFAKQYLNDGNKINIKSYILRRITRLEPPYVLALIAFFVISVFIGKFDVYNGMVSLLSSIFYINTIMFNDPEFLLVVVIWSLEIEVQFYLSAIFFSRLFKLNAALRRCIFIATIFGVPALLEIYHPGVPTILSFLHYFFIGFLLVDLKLSAIDLKLPKLLEIMIGLVSLAGIVYINHSDSLLNTYVFILSSFVLYYLTLFGDFWKSVFSIKIISVIGGMCYSIYLLHSPIYIFFQKFANYFIVSDYQLINLLFSSMILIPFTIAISAIYFLTIEKPCMDKNWPQKLMVSIRHRFSLKS